MDETSEYNRKAWDHLVSQGNEWTVPVTAEEIDAAREGNWSVVLTPEKKVPRDWFGDSSGLRVLALASGGGQQVPILAAAGAKVTVLDNSPKQLDQDQSVADRHGLVIKTVLGDMRELSCFASNSFDLVFNPCSIGFVPNVQPVFNEVARVLRPGGRFLAGFTNPVRSIFDEKGIERNEMLVRHSLPYSDETHLTDDELNELREDREPFMFSHTLDDLIGGQLEAGLRMTGFFEDRPVKDPASKYFAGYFATRFEKPTP